MINTSIRATSKRAFALAMLRRRRGAGKSHGLVFPDSRGGWRDASNTLRDLRNARGSEEFAWVTSHVLRRRPRPNSIGRACRPGRSPTSWGTPRCR